MVRHLRARRPRDRTSDTSAFVAPLGQSTEVLNFDTNKKRVTTRQLRRPDKAARHAIGVTGGQQAAPPTRRYRRKKCSESRAVVSKKTGHPLTKAISIKLAALLFRLA